MIHVPVEGRSYRYVNVCAKALAFRSLGGALEPRKRLLSTCGLDDCVSPSHMEYRAEARRTSRQSRARLVNYGVSESAFRNMWLCQGGACAICKTALSTKEDRAHAVDHDHKTDEVRELLCQHCNRGLGLFRDRPDLLRAAADYLVKHGKPESP
jgi:hypothetical protein